MKRLHWLIGGLLSIVIIGGILFPSVSKTTAQDNDDAIIFDFEAYQEGEPVLPLGDSAIGEWDSSTIWGPYVLEHDGLYYMFYTGNSTGLSFEGLSIGYATSTDGITWAKSDANPVFRHEGTTRTSLSRVLVEDDTWMMYYIIPNPNSAMPTPTIYRATALSPDGPWTTESQEVLIGNADRWDANIGPQSIVRTEGEYRLYYTGFNRFMQLPQYGVATSTDGLTFTPYDDPETTELEFDGSDPILQVGEDTEGWEFVGITASTTLQTENGWELFYMGHSRRILTPPSTRLSPLWLGYATSNDGIHWTKHNQNPVIETPETGWPLFSVIIIDDTYHIYHDHEWGREGVSLMTGTINRN